MADNTRDIDFSTFNSKLGAFVGGLGPDERHVMTGILNAAQSQLHGTEVSGYDLSTVNELATKIDWNGIMSSPTTSINPAVERHSSENT